MEDSKGARTAPERLIAARLWCSRGVRILVLGRVGLIIAWTPGICRTWT